MVLLASTRVHAPLDNPVGSLCHCHCAAPAMSTPPVISGRLFFWDLPGATLEVGKLKEGNLVQFVRGGKRKRKKLVSKAYGSHITYFVLYTNNGYVLHSCLNLLYIGSMPFSYVYPTIIHRSKHLQIFFTSMSFSFSAINMCL